MLELAKKFLFDLILENEEVKKFPKDFVTASMQWIRSWFLIDDPVTEAVLSLPGNEEAKLKVLETKLPTLLENESFKLQLEARLAEYDLHKTKIKNSVEDSTIEISGSVYIGDKGNNAAKNDHYDQKNTIKGSTIKAGGDFHIGDTIAQAGSGVHFGDVIHYHNATQSHNTQLQPPTLFVKQIRDLISVGRAGETFPLMVDYFEKNTPHRLDEALQLSARWETLKRKERIGVLSNSEANIERNQVCNAILELISYL